MSRITRRAAMRGTLAIGSAAALPLAVAAPASAVAPLKSSARTKVVLLGTAGGPSPSDGRRGIASVLVANGVGYVVDAGAAAAGQLWRGGMGFDAVRGIFVTHLHSDHIADLYNMVWLNWKPRKAGDTVRPVHVFGPGRAGGLPDDGGRPVPVVNPANPAPGTADYFAASIVATAYDINERMRDTERADIRNSFTTQDIEVPDVGAGPAGPFAPDMQPWPVYRDENVEVTATLVAHPPVFPSFAFRFDTPDGAVVFSGDTAVCDNLVRLASGADVLCHEVVDIAYYTAQQLPPKQLAHLRDSHTDVTDVGKVAARAGVRALALHHFAPADPAAVPDHEWERRVRKDFDGDIVIGHDLDEIAVTKRNSA
ncbi:MBL fold metallo-hydrolase [Amycolatopsis benzoatilytica]|uniref:MBL fold metallo-hydrolase n=1 Tax=Amycolatopsis benzoatilytica TaxID=346045 RepID=UPI00036EA736|nr:MBL fold metallo-hydrolase [Amycolatopsis benzoatilytica]